MRIALDMMLESPKQLTSVIWIWLDIENARVDSTECPHKTNCKDVILMPITLMNVRSTKGMQLIRAVISSFGAVSPRRVMFDMFTIRSRSLSKWLPDRNRKVASEVKYCSLLFTYSLNVRQGSPGHLLFCVGVTYRTLPVLKEE